MSKNRNFTFTWNNYPEDHETTLDSLKTRYIIYGKEVSSTGTPHLQGTVCFQSPRTHQQAVKLLPGCHVEICKALHASIEYCKKDGSFTERGEAPKTPKEIGADNEARAKRIREALLKDNMDEVPETFRLHNWKTCDHFRQEGAKRRKLDDTEETHEWYWGASRTGKSRKARTENPGAYLKMCNKWWDGYDDEEVVIIEDLDAKHDVLCHHLKVWADRYDFLAEMKGTARRIRPKKVIVTSNYHPSEIWFKTQDLEPILERFDCKEFKKLTRK